MAFTEILSDGRERTFATALFAACSLFVPTPAWFLSAEGCVPIWGYIPIALLGGFIGLLLGVLYLAVYAWGFALAAQAIAAVVFGCLSRPVARLAVLIVAVGLLAGLSAAPIYQPINPGGGPWVNWYQLVPGLLTLKG